jgi:DNA-nicking Smr family endonuclease
VSKGKKEFGSRPFAAIKGIDVVPLKPVQVAEPEPAAKSMQEDGDILFLREMAGVRRIRQVRKPVAQPRDGVKKKPEPVSREIQAADDELFIETLSRMRMDVRFSDEIPEPEEPAVPRHSSRLKQLRRGTIRLDLELDLHGLTRDEALDCLSSFVSAAFRRGQQAVLVITGKGNNSPGEPVLQKAVASWLKDEGAAMVAEYLPAPIDMGGLGAFVVFLKAINRNS